MVEVVDARQTAVQPDRILRSGELRGARRQDQVLQVQGVRDVERRQSLRVQLVEVEIHHDLAVLPAERVGHGGALDGRQRRPDEVVGQVENLLLLERRAAQPELQNRHARRVVLEDLRRKRSRRHVADLHLALRHDLREREIHFHAGMKVDPNDRHALVGLRFDMFNADDVRGEPAFEIRDDAALHLFRRESVVLPDDADDREVDIRKDVDGHRGNRDAAQDGDEQRHDDERVRAPQREPDDPHGPSPDVRSGPSASVLLQGGRHYSIALSGGTGRSESRHGAPEHQRALSVSQLPAYLQSVRLVSQEDTMARLVLGVCPFVPRTHDASGHRRRTAARRVLLAWRDQQGVGGDGRGATDRAAGPRDANRGGGCEGASPMGTSQAPRDPATIWWSSRR